MNLSLALVARHALGILRGGADDLLPIGAAPEMRRKPRSGNLGFAGRDGGCRGSPAAPTPTQNVEQE